MALRCFIPCVEQLESRQTMTVMADVMPHVEPASNEIEAAAIATHNQSTTDLDVVLRTEVMASAKLLVVQWKKPDVARTIGIVGGESARIDADGTARLHLPSNVSSVELTVSDSSGGQYSFMRVQFDVQGNIVGQTRLMPGMLSTPDHNSFHGTTDQISRRHGDSAHDTLLRVGSASDRSMTPASHGMDGGTFDRVLAHFGMSSMPAMAPYNIAGNHSRMSQADEPSISETLAEADVSGGHVVDDGSPIELAMAMPFEYPEQMNDADVDEFVDLVVEDFEVAQAAFAALPGDVPVAPETSLVHQVVFQRMTNTVDQPPELPTPAAEEPPRSNLALRISSGLLAIICLAGAFALEHKAAKTTTNLH
jgi:hypothetical protein